jgi:hypothetical protein
VGAVVLRALDGAEQAICASAESSAGNAGTEKPAQRRADALGLLAERALQALGTGGRGEPYQVVLHVDADLLADPEYGRRGGRADRETEGECCIEHGPRISSETARRIACDAPVVTMVHGVDGHPLSVGRKSRRVSTALHRALKARDRCCVFPGCTRTHTDVHHIAHWADGGTTDLENTCLLCTRHHQLVHEGGIAVTGRAPDGLVFRTAAGYPVTGRQAAPELPGDPVAALEAQHQAEGLEIDAETSQPSWWGERLDAGLAVSRLLSHDQRTAVPARGAENEAA